MTLHQLCYIYNETIVNVITFSMYLCANDPTLPRSDTKWTENNAM